MTGKLDKYEDDVFKVVYEDDMKGVEVVAATEEVELTTKQEISKFKELMSYNGILNLERLTTYFKVVDLNHFENSIFIQTRYLMNN